MYAGCHSILTRWPNFEPAQVTLSTVTFLIWTKLQVVDVFVPYFAVSKKKNVSIFLISYVELMYEGWLWQQLQQTHYQKLQCLPALWVVFSVHSPPENVYIINYVSAYDFRHNNEVFPESVCLGQHVTVEDSYLCGYLKIKGLTEVSFETRSDIVRLTFLTGFYLLDTCLNCDKD